jgi:hypothetical protein
MDDIIIVGPSGTDNFERGDRALKALFAYRENPDIDLPSAEELAEAGAHTIIREGSGIAYLIADLMHVAQRVGVAVPAILAEGMEHYGCDCIEQAWENSEEWANNLQDESNLERAEAVLETAGVPTAFWRACMVKTGFIAPDDDIYDPEA